MTKTKKRSVIGLVVGIVVLLIACVFMWFINVTALFADINTVHEGYLPLSEFTLRDSSDVNKLVNNTKSPFNYDVYQYASYDPEEDRAQTSKGVRCGISYEEFLQVYGSYIADSINVHDSNYEGEHDDEYYDTHYLTYLTPQDLLKSHYSLEELVAMDAYVRVDFVAYVKGNQVAYTQDELYGFYDQEFDTFWPKSGVFNPRMQTYHLDFSFQVHDGKLVLTSIDSSRYAY